METIAQTPDEFSPDHATLVAACARAIAIEMGLSHEMIAEVETVGFLHDIGKIDVSAAILRKPGPLTAEEHAKMQRHCAYGAATLRAAKLPARVVDGVFHHHERFAGGGYPSGIAGETIPLASRIVAAADAYAAMTTRRPYQAAAPPEHAISILRANAGSQFDPHVVDAFLTVVSRVRRAAERVARQEAKPAPSSGASSAACLT